MILFLKRYRTFILHIIVWLLFIAVIFIQEFFVRGKISKLFFINMGLNMLFFYVNYLILIPRLLIKRRVLLYILGILILLVFSSTIFNALMHYFPPDFLEEKRALLLDGKRIIGDKRPRPNLTVNPIMIKRASLIGFPIIINLSFLIIGTAIRMYVEWNRNENKKKEVEKLSTTSQLYFLKNQINPHFFFNSLNTIYSLASKKSADAPEAIITLSDLMRYMLYRTNKDFVPLQEEFDYINNYMKLQRLRIADDSNVSINIFGNVTNQKISPLLLISFIENAFKYGTDYKGNTEIRIIINVELNYLHFYCVNLMGSGKKEGEDSGIGLKNTMERLNLLYPDQHELITKEEDGKFIVDLNLKLY